MMPVEAAVACDGGNTSLHISSAASNDNQIQAILVLLGSTTMEEPNAAISHHPADSMMSSTTLEQLQQITPSIFFFCSGGCNHRITSPLISHANRMQTAPTAAEEHAVEILPAEEQAAAKTKTKSSLTKKEGNDEWLGKMRGWLMVVAGLVMSASYQSGTQVEDPNQLDPFFVTCNSVAFGMSLGIIILLMSETTYHEKIRLEMLRLCVVGSLISLAAAYALSCLPPKYNNLVYFFCALFAFVTSVVLITRFHKWKGKELLPRLRS